MLLYIHHEIEIALLRIVPDDVRAQWAPDGQRGARMKFTKALFIVTIVCVILALSGCTSLTPKEPTPQPTMTMVYMADTPIPTPTPTIVATPKYTPTPTPTADVVDDYYNVSISLTISPFGDILINNTGGPGVQNLMGLSIQFVDRTGYTRGPDSVSNLANYGVSGDLSPVVGSSALIDSANCGYMTHTIVLGTFRDGKVKNLAEEYLQSGYS
jgi:hypothetical protein